jgi:trypsin-like peptidase/colicin V production protein
MVGASRRGTPSTLRAVSWVDIVIIVWVALAALRGRSLGALTQLLALAGFVAGLAIGAVVAVPIASHLQVGVARTVVTVCVVLGVAVLGAIGGNTLGKWANVTMRRLHLGTVDAIAGAAVAALGALLSAWLVAGLFTQSSVGWLARPIQHSAVLTALDAVMPPVPSVIARAQAFVSSEVFPLAFAALTQPSTTSVSLPTQTETAALAARASASVLKVTASGGCSVTRVGTSFVVAPGLVITNAHVVAGEPIVTVSVAGRATRATLVEFDPSLDVAVLRVPGLALPPVPLDSSVVATGTTGAVIGFPGGGPKVASPAGVAGALTAQGRDIYGGGLADRAIYAVTSTVLPGNSGSPLVTGNAAAGMVFSRSLSQPALAYAIQASALVPEVAAASHATAAVGSGACTPG